MNNRQIANTIALCILASGDQGAVYLLSVMSELDGVPAGMDAATTLETLRASAIAQLEACYLEYAA